MTECPVIIHLSEAQEHLRLVRLLHAVADGLGLAKPFGAVEEAPLLAAVERLKARSGTHDRLPDVLEAIREAHHLVLMGSAPAAKLHLGEAARLLAALIDGRV